MPNADPKTTDDDLWAIGLTLLAMLAMDASAGWWCPLLARALGWPD